MPPTGTNRPSATRSLMRSNSSGWCSFTHAYCCAEEQAKVKSSCSSMRLSTLEKVRVHLRAVSRVGQSHAESMCACPTATVR